MTNRKNFIHTHEITFHKIKIFIIKNSSSRYNKKKNHKMQNLILFQTATNSDRQSVPQTHKKLENKANQISPHELSSHKNKIFPTKNFYFVKVEFVSTNEIFLLLPFLVQFSRTFSISINDSLKENSILHLLLVFYSQNELLIRKILIF